MTSIESKVASKKCDSEPIPPSVPRMCLAPLPETIRGYAVQLYAHKDKLVYGSGKMVVIRSLKNPSEADYFLEHKGKVNVAAFSPNGEWIASGDETGTVLVWGARNKIIKNTVKATRKVLDLCWSLDGQRIVAVGDGNESKAKVFAWDTDNAYGAIDFHSKAILSCSFRPVRPFRIVTGSEDLQVNFYEGPPFKWSTSFKEHERFPNCVRYSPDGSRFISVGADCKIFVFEGKDGKLLKKIEKVKNGHTAAITAFCWSPDGKMILTSSCDKTCKVWDIEKAEVVKTFKFAEKPAVWDQQMGCLWHGEYMISVSLSGAINYLSINSETPTRVVMGHRLPALGFAVDRTNNTFYTSDQDGFVGMWEGKTGSCTWMNGTGHGGKGIVGVAVSCDSKALYTVGLDDSIKMNTISEKKFSTNKTDLKGSPVAIAAAHKTAGLCAVVLAQQKVVLLSDMKVLFTESLAYRPTCIAFSPDDKELSIGGNDNKVHIYTVASDKLTQRMLFTEHLHRVVAVSYSQDGTLICSSDAGRNMYTFVAKDGKIHNTTGWPYHSAPVNSTAFSPNTKCLASCSQDQDVFIWTDLEKWDAKYLRCVLAHLGGADHVDFLDENTVISTGQDRSIKLWTTEADSTKIKN
eukprot:TRINITY_DN7793_c0_g1_i1.p1 TRINITY_DN7793_c0_g1~~TRINITY_DN7793_c0_g1_i1.p1  ORF type:complete len:632 (-),score=148.85 TRINITY_DN7793_c0_g1_i1:171-2066(-)